VLRMISPFDLLAAAWLASCTHWSTTKALAARNRPRWSSRPVTGFLIPRRVRRQDEFAQIDRYPTIEDQELAVIAVGTARVDVDAGAARDSVQAPKQKRGGPKTAPPDFLEFRSDQFGTARGLGGNAEFFCTPRIRSRAVLRALSFFGSGGT